MKVNFLQKNKVYLLTILFGLFFVRFVSAQELAPQNPYIVDSKTTYILTDSSVVANCSGYDPCYGVLGITDNFGNVIATSTPLLAWDSGHGSYLPEQQGPVIYFGTAQGFHLYYCDLADLGTFTNITNNCIRVFDIMQQSFSNTDSLYFGAQTNSGGGSGDFMTSQDGHIIVAISIVVVVLLLFDFIRRTHPK